MSFGFGVGDFIAVGQLTLTVYRSCKGAPGEFQELASELSSLHMILLNLEEDAKSPNSLLNRRGECLSGFHWRRFLWRLFYKRDSWVTSLRTTARFICCFELFKLIK